MNNCYFPHDSNARNSKKILRLRRSLGAEGYGTYFMLLERLREEQDFTCDADYEMLSYDLRVEAGIIKSVVEDFGLFELNEDRTKFHSVGFDERMDIKDQKSIAGKKGADARWGKKVENPSGMAQNGTIIAPVMANDVCHNSANGSSSDKENKTKEKESKENYCSSSQTLPPDGAREEEEFSEEEQKEEILSLFVRRNFRTPEEEYQKMVDYNSVAGRNWKSMTFEQRYSTAKLWQQKPQEPTRWPLDILRLWHMIYAKARALSAPTDVKHSLLSDRLSLYIRDDTLTIRCDDALYDFIEKEHLDDFKTILRQFMNQTNTTNLNYELV